VVVDAKITDAIDAFSGSLRRAEFLNDKRSRLLAVAIAACSLTGFERCEHPLRQRRDGIDEGAPHGGKHFSGFGGFERCPVRPIHEGPAQGPFFVLVSPVGPRAA
jgi:hypothetical protein